MNNVYKWIHYLIFKPEDIFMQLQQQLHYTSTCVYEARMNELLKLEE